MKALWLPQIVFNSGGGSKGGGGGGGSSSKPSPAPKPTVIPRGTTLARGTVLNKRTPSPSTANVTVKKNDTLSQIAKANNTSVAAIAAANPSIKNVNKINVGQKLKIPKNTGESTYAGGIGTGSGSGKVTRNKDGSIRVATGSKTSTTLSPVATGGIEPVETSTPTFSSYTPGQAANQAAASPAAKKPAAPGAVPQDMKPNILGYGYYDPTTGAWIPPEIDMKNGGGPGMAGEVFGAKGGLEADREFGNNDGYLTADEAKAAAEAGVFKYGVGSLSNASGATPFGSGREPTGIAGAVGNTMYGKLVGYDPKNVKKRFGPGQGMTQEEVNEFMGGTPQEIADRRAEQSRQAQAELSRSDNDSGPVAAPESTEVVPSSPSTVQCPEGYVFDAAKNACVIDPFAQPFQQAPAVAGGGASAPASAALSPYTASLPTNLSALNPSYVAGQQAVTAGSPIALSAIQPQVRTLPAGNIQQNVPGYPPLTPRPSPYPPNAPGLAGLGPVLAQRMFGQGTIPPNNGGGLFFG